MLLALCLVFLTQLLHDPTLQVYLSASITLFWSRLQPFACIPKDIFLYLICSTDEAFHGERVMKEGYFDTLSDILADVREPCWEALRLRLPGLRDMGTARI